ncbi:LysE family transporter [uncultured Flavobacterium sp.]|uniref:LysE family transporter n=1 Tax=uncultured Flavobacterium sp. TaxID=165435 RepID=UPI0025FBED78|nr:LysE family transporter [uncultured Flavobacterium sp.]
MAIVMALLWGLLLSAVGIALPGLINMTAAKISVRDGRSRALIFVAGALVVIFFQTYIAVAFAKLINSRPDLIYMLQEIGLALFSLLTIYFFFIAKKPKLKAEDTKVRTKVGRFFLGMLLSALNFFPIPYFVFVSVTLANNGHIQFAPLSNFMFVMGVVIGSFSIFYLYIIFFKRIEHKTTWMMQNMNYFLGSVTGLVAIVNLIKILRN